MGLSSDLVRAFVSLDLGPLRVEMGDPVRESGTVALGWENGVVVRFAVEARQARSMRDLQAAARRVRARGNDLGLPPLVVVPYLSDAGLTLLRDEGVSGLDHVGNGTVELPGRWWFFQRGIPGRAPGPTRPRAPYRGTSALVGRALLARPTYRTLGDVKAEVERRGGAISLSQVSKVLRALEEDLVIRKDANGISLLQPARLLDALVRGYRRPEPTSTLDIRASRDAAFFAALRERAEVGGMILVGYDPQRYVVAPEVRERVVIYVGPGDGLHVDLAEWLGLEPAARFANVRVQVVNGLSVLFDAREEDGFLWCAPLEVYLQLMQGGKREKEAAESLRSDILATASAES